MMQDKAQDKINLLRLQISAKGCKPWLATVYASLQRLFDEVGLNGVCDYRLRAEGQPGTFALELLNHSAIFRVGTLSFSPETGDCLKVGARRALDIKDVDALIRELFGHSRVRFWLRSAALHNQAHKWASGDREGLEELEALDAQLREERDLSKRMGDALAIAIRHGQTDGEHHKVWVIDQVIRALYGDKKYTKFRKTLETKGVDWDEGTPP